MQSRNFSQFAYRAAFVLVAVSVIGGAAPRVSVANPSNCTVNDVGDMVCEGTSGTVDQSSALGTTSNDPKGTKTTTKQRDPASTIGGVAGCDSQSVTMDAKSVTLDNGTVTVKTKDAHQFKNNDIITVAGAGTGVDGTYNIKVVDDHTFTYRITGTATGTIPSSGVTVTGDVTKTGGSTAKQAGCGEDDTADQDRIDELNDQLAQLEQQYKDLISQMNGMSNEDMQSLANQLAQAQGGGGDPMSMLQKLLGGLTNGSGLTPTPGGMSPTLNDSQSTAVNNSQQQNNAPLAKRPGDSGQVCNFDSTPTDKEKTERAIDNQIGVRYCVKADDPTGEKAMAAAKAKAEADKLDAAATSALLSSVKPSSTVQLTCEGVNKTVEGQVNGTGTGETTIPKADLDKSFDTAQKINEELTKPLTAEDVKECPCKKVGDPSAVKNPPKSCFTTVTGTAAYREGDGLQQKLQKAISNAKCGDFQKAGDEAKKALGGKLGDDGDAAFKSLGGDNGAGNGSLADDRKKFADELANNPAAKNLICGRMGTEDSKTQEGANMFIESVMNRASARGWTLGSTVTNSHGRYFPTNQESAVPNAKCNAAINAALAGGNTCNYCTGNGTTKTSFNPSSGIVETVPCGGSTIVGKGCTGAHDRYVVEANAKDKAWNKNAKENAGKSSAACPAK